MYLNGGCALCGVCFICESSGDDCVSLVLLQWSHSRFYGETLPENQYQTHNNKVFFESAPLVNRNNPNPNTYLTPKTNPNLSPDPNPNSYSNPNPNPHPNTNPNPNLNSNSNKDYNSTSMHSGTVGAILVKSL